MNRRLLVLTTALALVALPVVAAEWHTADNNVCTDCHTMHYSMQHGFAGGSVTFGSQTVDGNWLGGPNEGPNHYLLKQPANDLCIACHDGQPFAPDVVGMNSNPSPANGRSAGALNEVGGVDGYAEWMGHTLGSLDDPPGYNNAFGTYNTAGQLECVSCHRQHGTPGVYRNLMPRNITVTYAISTTRPAANTDVWINIDPATYVPGNGNAANFNPYYATANIQYQRRATPVAGPNGTHTVNLLERHCASCHGDFHGSPGESFAQGANTYGHGPGGVGGVLYNTGAYHEFIRHPSGQPMGLVGGGNSNMARYQAATTKVRTYSSQNDYSDAVPGCLSCHKAHGNMNPFGLVFLNRDAAAVNEEGGFAAGQTPPAGDYGMGFRNLCGQCHVQGN